MRRDQPAMRGHEGEQLTEPSWVIVRARSRCEDIVAQGFLNAGYRAYVPRYRVLLAPHGAQRRPIATMRALFAGLVFVQDWRGWPDRREHRISQVIGLMPGMRSGSNATLSGRDIATLMEHERIGAYEPHARRPPANGLVLRDDLQVGQAVEYDIAGTVVEAVVMELSPDGRATIQAAMFGREPVFKVDAGELRAVSA